MKATMKASKTRIQTKMVGVGALVGTRVVAEKCYQVMVTT